MSCSVYLFIIIFMLNVQYHKFSITFTDRNSSTFSATHDSILRDVIIDPKPKLLNTLSDIGIAKPKDKLTESTTAPTKAKSQVPIESHNGESLELTKNNHKREKRSRRQHPKNKVRTKLSRGLTKVKENNVVHVENSTREARQILKANILELFDIKPTTISDNIDNDPYFLNDIEPYGASVTYSKKKLNSFVHTDDEKPVIESPDLVPKKRKRTEMQNDIDDTFDVYYYTDQKQSLVLKVTESNEDPAIIGTLLSEPKANERTRPMEATANIYYEDTSDCKQDTWQTIALRHMQGAHTGRTRKTWRFNLKKQSPRTVDVALVQRLLRGYKEQKTEYIEQSLFHKNLQSSYVTTTRSRRKSKKLKIGDDGSLQYDDTKDAANKDENVVEVTEMKEYDTILGPVPAPEIEIHTMPMHTAVTYYKYKETGETLSLRTKSSTPLSTFTERVWVYSFKKYATRHYGAITNTYLLTNANHYTSTTTELTVVDTTSSEPTVFTYEEKQTSKTIEPESAQTDPKKKLAKGAKGSGNDWLYDVNDPDQVAYEMKVTEEDEENSDIRFHARSVQNTNIQRRLTYRGTTANLIRPAVRNSAVSSHPVRWWTDYLKKCSIYNTRSIINIANLEHNAQSGGTLVPDKLQIVEEHDELMGHMESCHINEENGLSAVITADWLKEYNLDYTIPGITAQVMHCKDNDAKSTDKNITLNQKFKCVFKRIIRT